MDVHRRTRTVVNRRLLTVLFGIALISHIDRSNVSFAALDMNKDLGISSTMFGLAAGIFFIGYAAGGLPHAAILDRFRSHKWLGAMVGLWGLSCMALAFVPNSAMFVLFRFLIGLAEAAFIPAAYTAMARFYTREDLPGATAKFTAAAATASLIGAPLAAVLLQIDWVGMVGWQWLFILQGLPAVLIAPFVTRLVPYNIDKACWLPHTCRVWLRDRIAAENESADDSGVGPTSNAFAVVVRMRRVWLLSGVYFTVNLGFWGLVFFLPQVLKAGFTHLSSAEVSLVAGLPYAAALATMLLFGRASVATGDRRWHLFGLLLGSGLSLVAALETTSSVVQLVALTAGISLSFSAIGLYHSVTASTLSPETRAMGVSLVNGLGLLGGFVGPYLFGWLSASTGSNTIGFYLFAAAFLTGAVLVVVNPRHYPNSLRPSSAPTSPPETDPSVV